MSIERVLGGSSDSNYCVPVLHVEVSEVYMCTHAGERDCSCCMHGYGISHIMISLYPDMSVF